MSIETERAYRRHLLQALGWVCVALGAIGVVLPIMPTTVFLLIALWAFARSSPRLHTWLLTNPHFGPYIDDWEKHRIIPIRGKVMAVTMMSASAVWLALGTSAPVWVVAVVALILVCVAAYILSRPSRPGL
jgi:uncharacterized protein